MNTPQGRGSGPFHEVFNRVTHVIMLSNHMLVGGLFCTCQ
jgi:hypothetical protein